MFGKPVVICIVYKLYSKQFSFFAFIYIFHFPLLVLCVASDTQSMMSDETNLSADGQDSPPDMDSASGTPPVTLNLFCSLGRVIRRFNIL